jgi:two-component system response regulator AtoC
VSTLPESELFGYERGAFTGAEKRKIGKFEHARAGTVFLDEIGDLALTLQAKLLRVLQEREFERVGGVETLPFEARIIAATNRDLDAMVRDDRFREDLFYRLAVSRIRIPPLRERQGDIPLLVDHLIRRIASRIHRRVDAVEEEALQLLTAYAWPGNVRELENVLTRAIALAHTPVLTVNDLAFSLGRARTDTARHADATDAQGQPSTGPAEPPGLDGEPLEMAGAAAKVLPLREAERRHIRSALAATRWNITQAARLLEISPTTLRKKIADYKLRK